MSLKVPTRNVYRTIKSAFSSRPGGEPEPTAAAAPAAAEDEAEPAHASSAASGCPPRAQPQAGRDAPVGGHLAIGMRNVERDLGAALEAMPMRESPRHGETPPAGPCEALAGALQRCTANLTA